MSIIIVIAPLNYFKIMLKITQAQGLKGGYCGWFIPVVYICLHGFCPMKSKGLWEFNQCSVYRDRLVSNRSRAWQHVTHSDEAVCRLDADWLRVSLNHNGLLIVWFKLQKCKDKQFMTMLHYLQSTGSSLYALFIMQAWYKPGHCYSWLSQKHITKSD